MPTEVILHAIDGIQGMAGLPNDSIDVVVTSPPYNLGIRYRKYNDHQKHEIYMQWTGSWMDEVFRVLAPNGSFFLNLGASPSKPMLPYQIAVQVHQKGRWILQNTFHWIKAITVDVKDTGPVSVGHFKPLKSDRFVNDCHEFIYHFTKTGRVPLDRLALGVSYADKSNIKRWAHTGGRDKRCRGNTWYIPYKTIQNRNKQRPHPATFPPKLAEYAIRIHGAVDYSNLIGPERLAVLDPFVGIGNTVIGAMDVGVGKVVGFDIDESYIVDAKTLIEAHRVQMDYEKATK